MARVRERAGGRSSARRKKAGQEVRNPIRQMLRLAIPGYIGLVRPHKPNNPFEQRNCSPPAEILLDAITAESIDENA